MTIIKTVCLSAILVSWAYFNRVQAQMNTSTDFNLVAKREGANVLLSSESFIHYYGDLRNFRYLLKHEKEINVAFLGGSITKNDGWRDQVGEYLKSSYPNINFNLLNAGIPSLGSVPHAFRFKEDVLAKGKVDLLFIESAVNDRGNGTPEIQQRRALEGIVRQALKSNPHTDIILMAFADELKMEDYRSGKVPPEVRIHQEIASKYKLPFINLAEEVTRRIDNKEFSWKEDFKNLHPSPFGQEVYFRSIQNLFERLRSEVLTASGLSAHVLPRAMEKKNYCSGRYVPVSQAQSKGFQLNPAWKPKDGAGTRPGFSNRHVLEGEGAGVELRFNFQGDAVGIAVNSGPDAGVIEYSIDGGALKEIDLYTPWSKSLHLPWYLVLGDSLKAGTSHHLLIRIKNSKNTASKGQACRIVHFLVN